MTIGEFQRALEEWIPPATAWKGDNVGLQVGDPHRKISNVLLALDATLDVAAEAKKKKRLIDRFIGRVRYSSGGALSKN